MRHTEYTVEYRYVPHTEASAYPYVWEVITVTVDGTEAVNRARAEAVNVGRANVRVIRRSY